MSKLFIENSTLTAIGDAIREKTGKTALIAPGAMPAEIKSIVSGGGGGEGDCNGLHLPEEALVLTGNFDYAFYYGFWNWFIETCGNRITTKDIKCSVGNVFVNCVTLEEIPFEINFQTGSLATLSKMFSGCNNLKAIPPIKNAKPINMESMFTNCQSIEVIPDDYCATWDWTEFENESKSSSQGRNGQMINYCNKLRSFPKDLICHGHSKVGYTNSCVYFGFQDCYSLTKIEDIYVPSNVNWTSNAFSYSFKNCHRLKKLTFKKQADGTPYTANWKSQTIDLSRYVGYGDLNLTRLGFNDDTKIINQSQRNDYRNASVRDTTPGTFEYDGWADNYGWSTFGVTAARELIDSLPDTSTYLASAGGTNTLKLDSRGAMNDPFDKMSLLTEEDIAVAAAKGWTVSLV